MRTKNPSRSEPRRRRLLAPLKLGAKLFVNALQDINEKSVRPDLADGGRNGMHLWAVIADDHDLALDQARRNISCQKPVKWYIGKVILHRQFGLNAIAGVQPKPMRTERRLLARLNDGPLASRQLDAAKDQRLHSAILVAFEERHLRR